MLKDIENLAATTDYDFRVTASPDDPSRKTFPGRVQRYRFQWALARALQPRSILGVGFGFGYSAAAFLASCPQAAYLGIEFASAAGHPEGLSWAHKITHGLRAEFRVLDAQSANWPCGVCDLAHIERLEDPDVLFSTLQRVAACSQHVLLDDCLQSRVCSQAVNEFLFQQRSQLEFYEATQQGGELLIKFHPSSTASTGTAQAAASSSSIRDIYTSKYYLEDCGGYVEFRQNAGKRLEDARLIVVAALAGIRRSGRILDIGCGRGELTHYFAQQGFEVTAIDYSADAIRLAETCFSGEQQLRERVRFICGDACSVPLQGQYDVVVASDVIEHLTPPELGRLYSRIAQHLAPQGIFVLHTYPNRWYYDYEYPRKRRVAASVGAYLPPEPRSAYERMVHINEQSPPALKRSLKPFFPHVLLWFGSPDSPAGSLLEGFSKQALRSAPDLFAVASAAPLDRNLVLSSIATLPLPAISPTALNISATQCPPSVRAGETFEVAVSLDNTSIYDFSSFRPNPVRISYRWMDGSLAAIQDHEGLRSPLWPSLRSGESRIYPAQVQAPRQPGSHVLRLTLVQEFVRWLDQPPISLAEDVALKVVA